MSDQIIRLKDKTDRMVTVRIPVSFLIVFGRDAINDEVSFIIAV